MKNIGLMAHVDAGKTTITEQLLFHTGAVRTLGSVDDGTAQTDYMEIEKKRGISVFSAVTQIETEGGKVNLVDTPGHIDFAAEVERALMVLDGVVLVISAVEGLQAHTEIIFRALRRRKIPVILFINKIDRAGADVKEVCTQIRARLDDRICPLYAVTEEGTPQADVVESDFREEAALLDEVLFEQYMEGTLTVETAFAGLCDLTADADVYPVLYGSAINGKGITHLLDRSTSLFRTAQERNRKALQVLFLKSVMTRKWGRRPMYAYIAERCETATALSMRQKGYRKK